MSRSLVDEPKGCAGALLWSRWSAVSSRSRDGRQDKAKGVQHVGAWLLLVTIAGLGFYKYLRNRERRRTKGRPLRVAAGSVLSALAFDGRCVESIRRLSVAAMMLADAAPSATWVRRTLGG